MELKVIVDIETEDQNTCGMWCNYLDFDQDSDYEISTYCKLFERFLKVNTSTETGKTTRSVMRCSECLSATV